MKQQFEKLLNYLVRGDADQGRGAAEGGDEGRGAAEGGAGAVTKSAEGGAVTYCRRSVHLHPLPIGRVEIYRETRTLSIRQIVAGKFRPKKSVAVKLH